MKTTTRIQSLRRAFLAGLPLATLCALSSPLMAQDETVAGKLTVEDDIILKDRNLGALTETAKLFFEEDAEGGNVNVFYSWQSGNGAWSWGYETGWTSMYLGENHTLSLYNTDTAVGTGNEASIILNPGDGALGLVDPSITIDGDKVVTEGNSLTLLAGQYVPRSANNAGSADSFLMEGTYGGSGAIPTQGAGSRMMWYPEKSAFRVGKAIGSEWDNGNVGNYSVAMGYNTQATGDYSTAMGWSWAIGDYSTALGASSAIGDHSTSMGWWSSAYGDDSIAMGWWSYAYGDDSIAMGAGSYAYGDHSTVMGRGVVSSYSSTVIGYHNEDRHDTTDATTIAAAKTSWQGDDQHSVFEVGIGNASNQRKNALTVLQDGSVEVGKATAANNEVPLTIKADGSVILSHAQGDISMGVFGQ